MYAQNQPRHALIVRPGMRVYISSKAIDAHNNRLLPDHTGRVGFNDRIVSHGMQHEIVNRIAGSCELRQISTGRAGVWFNVHDLIFVQNYQGFTLYGKINSTLYSPDVPKNYPWIVEICYPNGTFLNWVSSPHGLWASMRDATNQINEALDKEAALELESARKREIEEMYGDDPDWHEQELWGREDY